MCERDREGREPLRYLSVGVPPPSISALASSLLQCRYITAALHPCGINALQGGHGGGGPAAVLSAGYGGVLQQWSWPCCAAVFFHSVMFAEPAFGGFSPASSL